MAQRNLKWYSVHTNVVALREMAQRSVEWYSVHTNGVALREMAQRNVEWCSVHANSVALREMGRRNVEWYSVHTSLQNIRHSGWTLNWLALLEIFRIVELACGVTWRLSRRNHQKYKPQMEQRSAGGHDVIECEDCRETITCCSCCIEESSLRLAVKQSQFGKFLLFSFPCRYCIYSLSFMKALIKHMVFAKATFFFGVAFIALPWRPRYTKIQLLTYSRNVQRVFEVELSLKDKRESKKKNRARQSTFNSRHNST